MPVEKFEVGRFYKHDESGNVVRVDTQEDVIFWSTEANGDNTGFVHADNVLDWSEVPVEKWADACAEHGNVVDVLYKKRFARPVDDEPMFTFRAKDVHSLAIVSAYRDVLVNTERFPVDGIMIRSIDEWIERAKKWREAHADLVNVPTF